MGSVESPRLIARIEALNYRCLRRVAQDLTPFQILVGPNASGKSTFLDVAGLIGDVLRDGVGSAVHARSSFFKALTWLRAQDSFEVAVELYIPPDRRERVEQGRYERARYELAVGLVPLGRLGRRLRFLKILGETLWLCTEPGGSKQAPHRGSRQRSSCTRVRGVAGNTRKRLRSGWQQVIAREHPSGDYRFWGETTDWSEVFHFGSGKAGLANLPEDEERFPISVWAKRLLMEGVQRVALNVEAIRRPAPPGSSALFQSDGSNLPWVVWELQRRSPGRFQEWVAHVRSALPDITDIGTILRKEDEHRYLQIEYASGLKAPSWVVSDGTLRLLALTALAYVAGEGGVYLIEEPENGIHPRAVESVFQSLSSAYDSQILCATHSPIMLSLAEPGHLLCFTRNSKGATDICRGDEHPVLRNWQREADLGTLFAAGVLG
ncbi:MAG TPA: AAA family ATPase [Phycisphaerae bacterium]|nr:AAA family ATPase [Phycisphaerae bacterium]HNU45433.1 AAA family ATPase [Phycisphaerae bacterium]